MALPVELVEIECRTLLNPVKGMPFAWTINPYRGCQHACLYCYARQTHRYLGYDAGSGFDRTILVKRNAIEVLRRELRRPTWRHEGVLLGANVDPYQPAERRYGLSRGVLQLLLEHLNPVQVLTKSPLIERDTDVLQALAEQGLVRVNVSLGHLDPVVAAWAEPGAPSPGRRLATIRALSRAGVPVGLMLAPLMPGINDDPAALEELVEAAREAGVTAIHPIALHLRPGAKEWFFEHLASGYPELVARYEALFAASAYLPRYAADALYARVRLPEDRQAAQWEADWTTAPRAGQLALAL